MSRSRPARFLLAACFCATLALAPAPKLAAQRAANRTAAAPAPPAGNPVLLKIMEAELARAFETLKKQEPAPYFMSYTVTERRTVGITAGQGALFTTATRHTRTVDVAERVAGPELDNTHGAENRGSGMMSALLPLEDDPDAIARVLWLTTDREHKRATRTFLQVKTTTAVRAREDDTSADFSQEEPQQHLAALAPPPVVNLSDWQDRAKRYSALFRSYPDIYRSMVSVSFEDVTSYFVSTEGSRVMTRKPVARLVIVAESRADDGMELVRTESFDAPTLDRLPPDAEVLPRIHAMAGDLQKLRIAPAVEPFNGPALLSGRAAAVFFHEVLGHRVEGQRQRGVQEGQTFAKKLNEQVLPPFLSVTDDPTTRQLNGVELNGAYDFDQEGIPARRVEVVTNGVLKEFLMSRTPVRGFARSNGHGRGQEGLMPVGRQGNLIVSSNNTVPDAQLRQALIEEIKRQNKPYGLFFEDIQGGFTMTMRGLPQAFQVLPLVVWRVYPDGRSDELVRGVEIVGTPLAALTRIVKTGTRQEVFNGICGAESGAVPVSAASPAMLFSDIEVQKRRQTQERPPILPPPGAEQKKAASLAAPEVR